MTEIENAKVTFADATINLEVAQLRFNDAKQELVKAINKPKQTPPPLPKIVEAEKPEVK